MNAHAWSAGHLLRTVSITAAIIAVMYGGCCALLFAMQRSLLYFPPARLHSDSPPDPAFAMPVDGATVLVSERTARGPRAILYFGGNGEDVSRSMPLLERAFTADALFALHYRGYTGSTGTPSEQAITADALMLFDRIHTEHPDIVVIGRSLGSGVAIHLASLRPASRLILVTPYDSLQEIAARRFALFPVRWLLLDKYESWRYAPNITAPTLLIAAEFDQVIPGSSTRLLFSRLPKGLAQLVVVPDADHNTISETTEYVALLRAGAS
jgi:pimeloyl-ACP methyl ester carboxylesterase